jgi:hypothetical protein
MDEWGFVEGVGTSWPKLCKANVGARRIYVQRYMIRIKMRYNELIRSRVGGNMKDTPFEGLIVVEKLRRMLQLICGS